MTTSPTRLAAFLDAIAPSTRPTLSYLHLQLPHGPFRFYPNGAEYRRRDAGADTFSRYALREESDIPANVDRQRHVLQTQYTDALLGQLLDRLESQDLLDESVLVVASDHGITFNPGVTPRLNSEAELTDDSVDDVFWSALFIKQAGQERGSVSDAPTEFIDVLPTLIDWLDADPGWELDGVAIDSLGDLDERTLCRPIAEGGSTATVECVDIAGDDVLPELLDSEAGHVFSAGDPALRVYSTGPYGGLVGRPVDELESGDASSQEVSLLGLERFSDIGADDLLPGLVFGSLRSGEQGVVLAFSLNGTIAAVTESFTSGDEPAEIAAVLPISLFIAGDNEIETFVVEGSPEAPTLHRAATSTG